MFVLAGFAGRETRRHQNGNRQSVDVSVDSEAPLSPVNIINTELPGVSIVEPKVFGDARGFFLESYNAERYHAAGITTDFIQDNHSFSGRGVLRGMHYQVRRPQAKLVSVIAGEVFDVAVDVRENSPTFGKWVGVTLSGDNHRQLFVPAGFAHGFCVVSETAHFVYKCSDYYDPEGEGGFHFSDPAVGIVWPLKDLQVSDKDRALPLLSSAQTL
jgi:dTDP-4-dehydrorhamnose 3,5-epimerase